MTRVLAKGVRDMEIIQATIQDLDELLSFYQCVSDHMEERSIRHWHWGRYPNEEMIREDVNAGNMYYLRTDGEISAAVVAMIGQEPEYNGLSWTCGIRPGVFHRLAVHPSMQGAGLGGLVLEQLIGIGAFLILGRALFHGLTFCQEFLCFFSLILTGIGSGEGGSHQGEDHRR